MFLGFAKRFLLAAGVLLSGQQVALAEGEIQTITFSTQPNNPVYGGYYGVAANASSGLEVSFSIDPNSTACSISSTEVTFTGVGNCTIIASQSGDGVYDAVEDSQSFTVNKAPQTIVKPSIDSQIYDPMWAADLTSYAIPSLEPASLSNATPEVCETSPNNGTTWVKALKAGRCNINASQPGNEFYEPASDQISFLIDKAEQSISLSLVNPGDQEFLLNGEVPINLLAGASSAPVVLQSLSPEACSATGTSVKMLDGGTCTIVANQAGDDRYKDALQQSLVFNIAKQNTSPVANAGSDRDVTSGQTVTLDATGSTDADGDQLTYKWFVGEDGDNELPSVGGVHQFTAPTLNNDETSRELNFDLYVDDGTTGHWSSVTITVKAPAANTAPIATIDKEGLSSRYASGSQVGLYGNGRDSDGTIASYSWTASNGATIAGETSSSPMLTAPTLEPGAPDVQVVISLVVTDNLGLASAPDTATITIYAPEANAAPVASISERDLVTTVVSGSQTNLFGSGIDKDGSIASFAWTATNGGSVSPEGSNQPTFTAPTLAAGAESVQVVVSLVVTDNIGLKSQPATVTFTVTAPVGVNAAPVAYAGPAQTVTSGATVTLAGSGKDADGTIIGYEWDGPEEIQLSDEEEAAPTFTAPTVAAGAADVVLTFNLVVTDDEQAESEPSTVTITVTAPKAVHPVPTIALIVPNLAPFGKVTILSAIQSSEPDPNPNVSYSWKIYNRIGQVIFESNEANAKFTPQDLQAGNYTWLFKVTGTVNGVSVATGNIYVQGAPANTAPTAVINDGAKEITVSSGETVTLDGSGSRDSESTVLAYTWRAPADITLSNTTAQKPTFVAPIVEVGSDDLLISFDLTVTDGGGLSSSSILFVIVKANAASVKMAEFQEKVLPRVNEVSRAMNTEMANIGIEAAFSTDLSVNLDLNLGGSSTSTAFASSDRFATPAVKAIDELALKGREGMRTRSGGSIPGLFAYDRTGPQAADAVDPNRWSAWGSARVSQLVTSAASADLGGNQYNFAGGASYRITPTMIVGALAGYETFKYKDNTGLNFSGDGYTGGAYAAWRPQSGLRFDGQVMATKLSYDVRFGTASAAYTGTRVTASAGVTGSMTAMSLLFEPSLRATATWEEQAAYMDSLGSKFAAKNSSNGTITAGLKASKQFSFDDGKSITPFASVNANYNFSTSNVAAAVSASDKLSARVGLGFTSKLNQSTFLNVDGSLSGIGLKDTLIWSLGARFGVEF